MQDAYAGPALRLHGGVLGIDDAQAIDDETIFVNASRRGTHGGGPHALIILGHHRVGAELAGDFHLGCLRCLDAERDAAIGENLGRNQRRRLRWAPRRSVRSGLGFLSGGEGPRHDERRDGQEDGMGSHESGSANGTRPICPSWNDCEGLAGRIWSRLGSAGKRLAR